MLAINPDECIDCGVCVPECPVDAIKPESEELLSWIERNSVFAKKWPKIETSKKPLPDAEDYKEERGKFERYIE